MWSWSLNLAFKATLPLQGGTRTFQNLNPYFWFWVCFHSTRQGSAWFQKGSRNLRTFMVCKNWGVNGDFFSILIFWNPVLVGFMSWKPKLCKDKQINTWNHLKYVHWIYNIWKFNFLNGNMEINQLFHDILILWQGPVYVSLGYTFIRISSANFFQQKKKTRLTSANSCAFHLRFVVL